MINPLLNTNHITNLARYNRIFVGYSGGLDSTVLLHCLAAQSELVKKLIAVHINHGISPHALAWQTHCQQFCQTLSVPLIIEQVDFSRQANIEEEARKARYRVFASLLTADDGLLLGHHLHDQAETLLLQLFRGAGVDGLAAMALKKNFAKGQLQRPLLTYSRQILENYAHIHDLQWVNDESNQDIGFSRNYLRHQVVPLLRLRWPAVVNNLVRTSQLCQQAQKNLDDLAKIDCPALMQAASTLSLEGLDTLNDERIGNILCFWLKSNQVKLPGKVLIERIINEALKVREDASPHIQWKEFSIRRYQQTLYLMNHKVELLPQSVAWSFFPKSLHIEGIGHLVAKKNDNGLLISPQAQIEIRFRRGGELMNWHGQTKQLKKLLQEWRIPPWLRDSLPLLYINEQLAVVVGYAIADSFYGKERQNSYQISIRS